MKCLTPWCGNTEFRFRPVTNTPGFAPDFECPVCGARWIDRRVTVKEGHATSRLYQYLVAVTEIRSTTDYGAIDAPD